MSIAVLSAIHRMLVGSGGRMKDRYERQARRAAEKDRRKQDRGHWPPWYYSAEQERWAWLNEIPTASSEAIGMVLAYDRNGIENPPQWVQDEIDAVRDAVRAASVQRRIKRRLEDPNAWDIPVVDGFSIESAGDNDAIAWTACGISRQYAGGGYRVLRWIDYYDKDY